MAAMKAGETEKADLYRGDLEGAEPFWRTSTVWSGTTRRWRMRTLLCRSDRILLLRTS